MNAKKAKALRRDVRKYGYSADAPETSHTQLRNGQIVNLPYSKRGLYRRLKLEEKGIATHTKDV